MNASQVFFMVCRLADFTIFNNVLIINIIKFICAV